MSIFRNPKKVLKKGVLNEVSELNALDHRKNNYKTVMILFWYFFKKLFRDIFYYHYMVENGSKNIPKNPQKFLCINCNYSTSNSKDYKKHLQTIKHKKANNDSEMIENLSEISPKIPIIYNCVCGNKYKYDSGYYRHKKKCEKQLIQEKNISDAEVSLKYQEKLDNLTNVVLDIVKQNNQLTKQIIDLSSKTLTNNYNNANNTNNSHNKTFNLQFFLNEQCKDALNIKDFVESIQVQISDLENTGKNGYVEGISKIFINNLEQLDTHERPIHCSDYKREILYIKDDNQWNKDDENKSNLTKAIKQVANKNIKQISEWQKINPEYKDPESKQNDKYMKIVLNAMSGSTPEEQKSNINKIIKNVTKEVVIEK